MGAARGVAAAGGWGGWRAYDYHAAGREARAAGFVFVEGSELRLATWTERDRRLFLPDGTDLAPLQPLLLRLDPTLLSAGQCRHVAALRGLTRLRILFLNGSDVKDLAPLAGLAQLQWLDLTGCTGVADLAPLAGLGQLQRLSLNGCTGLGAEAVKAFKKRHPQVEVTGLDGQPVNAE